MLVGFFGLGTMGVPMCQGLQRAGYDLILPTFRPISNAERRATVEELLNKGSRASDSQRQMISICDVILICVPKSAQVEQLVLGEDGILENAKPGTAVLDFTSADPVSAKRLSQLLEEKDIEFLDCPVSGGVGGVIKQTLAIMVGGKKAAFDKYKPILDVIGNPDKVTYVGPSGCGDMMKCANNFLSACCSTATTEALVMCAKAGIDPHVALDVINNSGGMNRSSMTKFPDVVFAGKKFDFRANLMVKDIGLFNAVAKEYGVPAFLSNTTAQIWSIPLTEIGEEADSIDVQKTYEKWAKVKICGIDE